MSSQRLVFRNGFVVSMDPDVGEIPNGEVLVEDGVIVDVGRDLGVSDAEEIDATGMIVMPGFVDTHRHTWQTPVRGVLPSCTLDHYFAVMLGQVGGFYRPEDVHIGDYAGALEALNGGVTTLLDWSHISNTPDHSDAAIQGLKDAGIRAVYAHGMPTGGEWWMLSELNHPEDIRRIRETYFSSDDGLLTLAMAARQPGNVNDDVARHDWALARELGILISVHVGMRLHNLHYTPVKAMHDLGLMGPDVCYIHMTDLTDEELDWIAETGGKASIAPYVEMLMGHGPPPTGKMVARGVRPSLSVDVVSSVPGEMFTQMRTALAYDRILEFTDTPDIAFAPKLTHKDVLEFATIDGARSIGLEDRVGSLTPGKQADIVLLNVNAINTTPMVDPIGTIVVFSDTSNVDSVFVAGDAVKRNGQLVDADLDNDLPEARRVEESHPRRRRPAPDWAAEPCGRLAEPLEPGPRPSRADGSGRKEGQRATSSSSAARKVSGASSRRPMRTRAVRSSSPAETRRAPRRPRTRSAARPAASASISPSRTRSRSPRRCRGRRPSRPRRDRARREQGARVRHRCGAPARHPQARRLHGGDPRPRAAAGDDSSHPHLRRPCARPALSRVDDGHDRQRRCDEPRADARVELAPIRVNAIHPGSSVTARSGSTWRRSGTRHSSTGRRSDDS